MNRYVFPPLILPLFILFIFFPLFLLLFVFGSTHALAIVFDMPRDEALILFLMIAIGSVINIPIAEKEGKEFERKYSFFGLVYVIRERKKIVIAVNVGGCVIPTLLALKILFNIPIQAFIIAFLITTLIIFILAKPVPGVGIAVPMLIPPLISAFSSYLSAEIFGLNLYIIPKLAFSVGVLGSLIGADVMHLKDIEKIGSGIASIGGAGTFDGIFLTGIFSVFFALILLG